MDSQKRLPTQHLLELSTPTLEHFSTIMRLTRDESTGMTLLGLQDHFPTFTDLWSVAQYGRDRPGTSSWAVAYSSRYCPECLRGDGTPVQDMLGGAWRLPWYLPVVFACPTHRRLLECFCPSCHSVPNGRASGRHGSLVRKPGVAGLHPAQCRNPAPGQPTGSGLRARPCGARLDEANSTPGTSLSRLDLGRLLALQVRLEQRLTDRPSGPLSDETDEGFYLPDLVVAAELIVLSWPAGADLADSHALASLVDAHAAPVVRRESPGVQVRVAPVDSGRCGALLLAAESLLGERDLASLHERVRPLVCEAQRRAPHL